MHSPPRDKDYIDLSFHRKIFSKCKLHIFRVRKNHCEDSLYVCLYGSCELSRSEFCTLGPLCLVRQLHYDNKINVTRQTQKQKTKSKYIFPPTTPYLIHRGLFLISRGVCVRKSPIILLERNTKRHPLRFALFGPASSFHAL